MRNFARVLPNPPPPATSRRVVIADDHAIVRDGLALIISRIPGVEIVGEASDGVEAAERYRELRPDLLVLDLRMPGCDGLEVLQAIVSEDPGAKVLIITTYDSDEDIYRAMRAGARGYLLKDSSREMIAEAVDEILRGGTYTPANVTHRLLNRIKAPDLTARELDVLRLVAAGLANKEIADRLDIGAGTVKTHVQSLLEKLDAVSRTQAVAIARERGLLA